MGGAGEGGGQPGGEAVGGDHVEADAGDQRDPGPPGLGAVGEIASKTAISPVMSR